MNREKEIDLLKRLYKYGEEGLTIDSNIAYEIEKMIESLESAKAEPRTALSELWACQCGWYGTQEEQDALGTQNGCCPQCGSEDLANLAAMVDLTGLAQKAAAPIEEAEPESEFTKLARTVCHTENVEKWRVRSLLDEACDHVDRLTAEKQAQAARIEKLESAKSEPGEESSCGIVKGLLDQLGRHRNLFDRLVAENNAQAERIEKLEAALAEARKDKP